MANRKLWKGLIAGGAAGLAASFAMNEFQTVWSRASNKIKENGNQSSSGEQSGGESEDATMKAAGKIAEITGHRLVAVSLERRASSPDRMLGLTPDF